MDEWPANKPRTPAFRQGNNNHGNAGGPNGNQDAWPAAKPTDDIGNKIKSYIKDMNKLIDEGMKPSGADEEEDDDDDEDDDNIEELPSVPETDDSQKQEARDDAIEDDESYCIEESKGDLDCQN